LRKNFVISKQSDIEGYSSFKCSLCGEDFKLNTHEVQEDDVIELFCPNCGIPSPISTYYTADIIEHAETLVMNEAMDMLNDMFKGFERTARRSKHITFKRGKPLPTKQPRALFENDDLEQIEFLCCNRKAKLSLLSKTIKPFCPYCGVN
jgi:DNA-directed RNA polymerase subunit RPC12/RpoP